MAITQEELLHLAKLSAIQLSSEEMEKLWNDLDGILAYVSQLQEVDTDWYEPLLQPIPGTISKPVEGVEVYDDPDAMLMNTKHQINHRHIVITSKKAEEN